MEDILHQLMQRVWNVDSFDITGARLIRQKQNIKSNHLFLLDHNLILIGSFDML